MKLLVVSLAACSGGFDGTTLFEGPLAGNVAVSDGTAYVTTNSFLGNDLYAVPIAGGEAVLLDDTDTDFLLTSLMTIADRRAVWGVMPTTGESSVVAVSLDTGVRETLTAFAPSTNQFVAGVVADADHFYASGPQLLAIPHAGGEVRTLGEKAGRLVVGRGELLFVEGGAVLALDTATGTTRRFESDSQDLLSTTFDPDASRVFAFDDSTMYSFDYDSAELLDSVGIDGGQYFMQLFAGGDSYGFRSDNDTHTADCDLVRIDAGGEVEELANGGCGQIAIDGPSLVVANIDTSRRTGNLVRYSLDLP